MKFIVLVFMICILLTNIFIVPGVCMSNSENEMKDIITNVLKEKYNWDYKVLTVTHVDTPVHNGIDIYLTLVLDGPEPPPRYIVTIDNKKRTYIFNATYIYSESIDRIEFNRLMNSNKINIEKRNLLDFIKLFLLVVHYNSKIITSLDDIPDPLPSNIREDKTIIDLVKPIKYKIKDKKVITEFFSWNCLGSLKKWNIVFSNTGEIEQYEILNIVKSGLYR